jgi:hypothetical protein
VNIYRYLQTHNLGEKVEDHELAETKKTHTLQSIAFTLSIFQGHEPDTKTER